MFLLISDDAFSVAVRMPSAGALLAPCGWRDEPGSCLMLLLLLSPCSSPGVMQLGTTRYSTQTKGSWQQGCPELETDGSGQLLCSTGAQQSQSNPGKSIPWFLDRRKQKCNWTHFNAIFKAARINKSQNFYCALLSTTESRCSFLLLEQKVTTQQWHLMTFLWSFSLKLLEKSFITRI